MYQQCCASKKIELHAPVQVIFLAKIEHWVIPIQKWYTKDLTTIVVRTQGFNVLLLLDIADAEVIHGTNCKLPK